MKNHELAINDFDQAIRIDPGYAEIYYYRGLSKIELKLLEQAIDDFN